MEQIKFDKDVAVMYVPAASFPDGVMAAHQKLHSMFPFSMERGYFGLSRPENGTIEYKAAASELEPGEAEKLGLPTIILKKGNYIAIAMQDYMKDIAAVQKTFALLTAQPNLDPEGYCVELYTSQTDMLCMIRLKD